MNILDFTDFDSVEMDDLPAYKRAVEKKIRELEISRDNLIKLKNKEPIWSEPVPLDTAKVPSSTIGVYKIIHKPSEKVMSIGQGNVGNRKGRHKSVFLNDGRDITHKGGTTSGSVTAQKMYRHDNDLSNWYFSFCSVGEKTLANAFESELQKKFKPPFNALHMGGNN
tara:strand:- start:2123 stop:2623 length:501 start_codon:yes stop_codon:yes gene_type:complete